MTEVALCHQMNREVLVRYVYNDVQDLVEIQDALAYLKINIHMINSKREMK